MIYKNESGFDTNYAVENIKQNGVIYFWSGTPANKNITDESCMCQWSKHPFHDVNNGFFNNHFYTAEHYMMFRKALMFEPDNIKLKEEILTTRSPKDVKRIGRRVQNFDSRKWADKAFDIVVDGNMYKFQQNRYALEYLLSTEDKILVEASPFDKIWGVGRGAGDKYIEDPRNWLGQNLLGFALMEVRRLLREENEK